MASLEARVGEQLTLRKATVAAVESCTGGLILHRLTNIPGSSAYVLGGFVTYSNEAKMQFAAVGRATLEQYGAVSEPTAREMVRGVRAAFSATYALSATGIVGPGGGTAAKPVGLVYIGIAGPDFEDVREYHWAGERVENKEHTADAALSLLLEYMESHP